MKINPVRLVSSEFLDELTQYDSLYKEGDTIGVNVQRNMAEHVARRFGMRMYIRPNGFALMECLICAERYRKQGINLDSVTLTFFPCVESFHDDYYAKFRKDDECVVQLMNSQQREWRDLIIRGGIPDYGIR